uniref:Uncharacterized protein LOC101497384 n=1 Tax=Cicer arietinum TaxID=3827 RepID=A0A1S2Z456_CICAR|nr:uncharacterized protein LOC101497384 [Cicer arietinum]
MTRVRVKKKSFHEEVVIDIEDEYEGDIEDKYVEVEDEIEIQGNSRCEANVENENDSKDEDCNSSALTFIDIVNHDLLAPLPPRGNSEFEVEKDDYDILVTPKESDNDEATRTKFPKFKILKSNEVVKFELGMEFIAKGLVNDVVKHYALERKKNVYLKKNDKIRIIVKFSKRSRNDCWQVTSFTEKHTYHTTAKNRQANTKFLAKMFINSLRHSIGMKTKSLIVKSKEKWGIPLNSDQAYMAKKRAIEMIQGAASDQYSHLRSYAEELWRSNPNNTVIIQCDTSDNVSTSVLNCCK